MTRTDSGVYALVWPNKYFYIGQTKHLRKRWLAHNSAFRSKRMATNHPKLFNVWNAHGTPQFYVLVHCPVERLTDIEQGFINQYVGNPMLANTELTACYDRNVDRRAKTPWQLGKTFTAEHRRNLSAAKKGLTVGVNNTNAKLTEDQVREIRARYGKQVKGSGSTTLAKDYGVSYRTILMIANGQRYANVI